MSKDATSAAFSCPLCGAKTYTEIYTNNGIRGPSYRARIIGYVCDGCSVQFGDPQVFAKTTHPPPRL